MGHPSQSRSCCRSARRLAQHCRHVKALHVDGRRVSRLAAADRAFRFTGLARHTRAAVSALADQQAREILQGPERKCGLRPFTFSTVPCATPSNGPAVFPTPCSPTFPLELLDGSGSSFPSSFAF